MGTPLENIVTKEYLQEIIRNLNGIIFIFHKTEDGRFIHTFCEGQLLEKMNLATDHVVGNELKHFIPYQSAMEKEAMYERAWNGESITYEGFDRNVSYIVTLSPVYQDDKVIQVIGTCIDIQERKERENLLETDAQHFKSFFTYNPDPIFSLDVNGYFTSVNSAGEKITGHTEQQMKQRTFIPYITEDYQLETFEHFQQVIRGESITFRCAINNTQNERRELRVTAVPILINGEVTGVYGTARDITEQLKDRKALEQSEERYRILVENSPIATAVHVDAVLKYVNPSFVSLFNAKNKSDLIGLSKWELIPAEHQDYIATLEETLESMEFSYKRREGKILTLDGRALDVEVTAIPIAFEGEKGILVMLSNISDRKKVEHEIEKILRQNERILNTAGDGILSISDEMTINFANSAALKLLGYEHTELIGRNVSVLFEASSDSTNITDLLTCTTIQKKRNEKIFRKKGDWILTDITLTPIMEDEQRNGTVLVFKDITQQQQLDELMSRSDKLSVLGELAAGIAHEIRNPLTSLKGFIQLIQSNSQDRYQEYCKIMLDELERVNGIVGEFLMLSKPQHAALKSVDPVQLIKEVVSFLSSEALLNSVNIHEEYLLRNTNIFAEANQLKQVFINLLKNAIESMDAGGNIFISVRESSYQELTITIQDEGCGIEEERLPTLGQPFYTTKERGTGLGLMICLKIIENHNGRISFSSKINVGTIVEITLPIGDFNQPV